MLSRSMFSRCRSAQYAEGGPIHGSGPEELSFVSSTIGRAGRYVPDGSGAGGDAATSRMMFGYAMRLSISWAPTLRSRCLSPERTIRSSLHLPARGRMRSGCQSLKTSSPLTQRQDGANKIRKAFVEGMRLNYLGFCDFKVVVVWGFTTFKL